jgi:hypothetical protein
LYRYVAERFAQRDAVAALAGWGLYNLHQVDPSLLERRLVSSLDHLNL